MLQSLDVNIRITAKPPINISPSPSAPSSPVPPAGSSSSGSSPLPIVLPPLRPPIMLTIPAQSAEPLTPSSYRTARTTPLSQRPPAAELSPKTRTPLSPAPPPVLPSQPSPSSVALPVLHLPHLPTVALTLTERATPAPPTARTLPGTSQSRESQRVAFSQPSPVALSVPLPGQPPTVVSSLTQRGVPAPPTYILPDGPQGRKSQEDPLPPSPPMATSVLHPKQPTTVASPSPGRAIPQPPTVHILPDISLSRETQTVVVPQAEAQVSSRVPIAGLPSSVLNVTFVSPWEIINTSKHKTEDHEGEFVDYVHIQAPPIVPPARDQLNVPKKNWFRKYLWDYKK
ncbi:hypothetical protein BC827DRAFT_819744 [Russula dissimulans]|nr:hypothetical protein BC827DRAFT_819744 [Russula dissimulans]